jgi:predicted O-methyltransferase YrrM
MQARKLCHLCMVVVYHIVFVRLFAVWERMGFHITPNHFYQPIPDTRSLTDDLWLRKSELVGVDVNEQGQIQLLREFSSRFRNEYDCLPKQRPSIPTQYYTSNPAFGALDGKMLYCMIRHFRPKRLIEIGSGYSTYLSAQALLKNEGESGDKTELIVVDPYPSLTVRNGLSGLSKLICNKVEKVSIDEFTKLQENDILFIDSTHVLRIGNDVQYIYLEILPRINKGVVIHVHDIFMPGEYPKAWVKESHIFWNEQYLLQSFLAFNNEFEVLWAAIYMHLRHHDCLEEAFGPGEQRYEKGGSFWMRRKV